MSFENGYFCTDLAWEYGLPLVGTATRGDVWFLLEYAGRWGAKAFEESNLPAEVKSCLMGAAPPGVEARVVLIKQAESRQRAGFSFFAGQTDPLAPRLYEYFLRNYEDLLDLKLAALAAGQAGDPAYLRTAALYLVCTNGKRDRCCARYGLEAYRAMREVAGEAVWQSSHIGGHNQAPITLFFPHGVNYGHTTAAESRRLVQAYQQGRVVLHHYRGRVCYDPPVQAAEHFWRAQTGELTLPGLRVEAVEQWDDDNWLVEVSRLADGQRAQIGVARRLSDFSIPIACSRGKMGPVVSFHQVEGCR
jgi:hypothetical protein